VAQHVYRVLYVLVGILLLGVLVTIPVCRISHAAEDLL
jgi:hypothetical protein